MASALHEKSLLLSGITSQRLPCLPITQGAALSSRTENEFLVSAFTDSPRGPIEGKNAKATFWRIVVVPAFIFSKPSDALSLDEALQPQACE